MKPCGQIGVLLLPPLGISEKDEWGWGGKKGPCDDNDLVVGGVGQVAGWRTWACNDIIIVGGLRSIPIVGADATSLLLGI